MNSASESTASDHQRLLLSKIGTAAASSLTSARLTFAARRASSVILARAVFVRDYMARHTQSVEPRPPPRRGSARARSLPLLPRSRPLARSRGRVRGGLHPAVARPPHRGQQHVGLARGDARQGAPRVPFRGSPEPAPADERPVSLVTGGSGFVGNRLARALVERGDRVRALVRDPAGAADLSALGVELVQGDMTDEASLRRAVEGVDRAVPHRRARRRLARSPAGRGRQRRRNASPACGSRRGGCHPRRARQLPFGPRHQAPLTAPTSRVRTSTGTRTRTRRSTASRWRASSQPAAGSRSS